jgi:undecaprenyl-diphosphatase
MTASLDDTITIWIATHRWAPLNSFFVDLSTVERLGAVWIVLALVLVGAKTRRVLPAFGAAAFTAVVLFAADAVGFGIKDLVARPRPFEAHRQIHSLYVVHSSSFPAGHAATAFAGAVLLSRFAPRWTALFVLLAAAIGFSRVYVGDHYVGDVIGGAFAGALVALAALAALRFVLDRRERLQRASPAH